MDIKVGDLVRATTGEIGTVTHITRLTAYITIKSEETTKLIPVLLSQLTKIAPPAAPN